MTNVGENVSQKRENKLKSTKQNICLEESDQQGHKSPKKVRKNREFRENKV